MARQSIWDERALQDISMIEYWSLFTTRLHHTFVHRSDCVLCIKYLSSSSKEAGLIFDAFCGLSTDC